MTVQTNCFSSNTSPNSSQTLMADCPNRTYAKCPDMAGPNSPNEALTEVLELALKLTT